MIALVASDFDLSILQNKLLYLDSAWYLHLATNGYVPAPWHGASGAQYAFFPVYPLVLKTLSYVSAPAHLLLWASFLSLGLFAIVFWHAAKSKVGQWGLFLLAFSPGAWVFFSNHTEALFLFLSYFAINSALKNRLFLASVLAGLAALTRNQGVLLAVSIALLLCFQQTKPKTRWGYLGTFTLSGLVSGSLFAVWLVFLYLKTGDILASIKAQQHWTHIELSAYVSKLLWLSTSNFYRSLLMWTIIVISIVEIRRDWRKNLAIFSYALGSALLWPLQGSGYNAAMRFACVIFPVWFQLGTYWEAWFDKLEKTGYGLVLRSAIILATIILSGTISSRYYFKWSWPY